MNENYIIRLISPNDSIEKLLNRTTRLVSPTEAGSLYFERCSRIVADAEEADSLLLSLQAEPKGTLKVASLPDLGII